MLQRIQRKRFFILLLTSFLLCAFSPAASLAADGDSVTILYTGAVKGNFEPIDSWRIKNSGGLARRAQVLETIRNGDQPILLLDCGDIANYQRKTAEFMLKAMGMMKYDALTLGVSDFRLGHKFLERSCSAAAFPCIASNLRYQGGTVPWAREYIIQEKGGIKVGIIGIVDPDELPAWLSPEEAKTMQAMPPENVLRRLLPEVRKKADVIILLSQLDINKQYALLNAVKGVDISISSATKCKCTKITGTKPEGTLFLNTGSRGSTMGLLKVALDDKRVPLISKNELVPMDSTVPGNEEMAKLVESYKDWEKIEQEKREKALREGLQLTPQEFMERYRKEQNE